MRITEFHKNKTLMKAVCQLAESDTFKKMRETLEDESPLKNPLSPQGPTSDDRSHRLGLIEGYDMCLKNLRLLYTIPNPPPKILEATYPEE